MATAKDRHSNWPIFEHGNTCSCKHLLPPWLHGNSLATVSYHKLGCRCQWYMYHASSNYLASSKYNYYANEQFRIMLAKKLLIVAESQEMAVPWGHTHQPQQPLSLLTERHFPAQLEGEVSQSLTTAEKLCSVQQQKGEKEENNYLHWQMCDIPLCMISNCTTLS